MITTTLGNIRQSCANIQWTRVYSTQVISLKILSSLLVCKQQGGGHRAIVDDLFQVGVLSMLYPPKMTSAELMTPLTSDTPKDNSD